MKLDVLKDYSHDSRYQGDYETNEKHLVMRVFSVVLCHCIHFIKGGWQQLEETVNFLLLHCDQVCQFPCFNFLNIFTLIYSFLQCCFVELAWRGLRL